MALPFNTIAKNTVQEGKKHIVDFLGGGYSDIHRSNLFAVRFQFGPITFTDIEQDILAVSVTYPRVTTPATEIRRMGRKIDIPTGIEFEPTTVTFYDDMDGKIRNKMWEWMQIYSSNTPEDGIKNESYENMFATMGIYQLNQRHEITSGVLLEKVWPTAIGDVSLDASTEDAVVTFAVTFKFSYAKFTNKGK